MNWGINNVTKFDVDLKETALGSPGNTGSTPGDAMPVLISHRKIGEVANEPISKEYTDIISAQAEPMSASTGSHGCLRSATTTERASPAVLRPRNSFNRRLVM